MFFSDLFLCKKGKLAVIWLAAHSTQSKLPKAQVTNTSILNSIDAIVGTEVPLALRLQGHLLLGIVRIYAWKVQFLLKDCNDALAKIKLARSIELSAHTTAHAASKDITRHYEEANIEEMVAEIMNEGQYTAHPSELLLAPISLPDNFFRESDMTFESLPFEDRPIEIGRAALEEEDTLPPVGDTTLFGHRESTLTVEPPRVSDISLLAAEDDLPQIGAGDDYLPPFEAGAFETPRESLVAQEATSARLSLRFQPPEPPAEITAAAAAASAPAATAAAAREKAQKRKLTREVVVRRDASTFIPDRVMQEMLENPMPTMREFEMAPPTKRRMLRVERENNVRGDRLFIAPVHAIGAPLNQMLAEMLQRVIAKELGLPAAPAEPDYATPERMRAEAVSPTSEAIPDFAPPSPFESRETELELPGLDEPLAASPGRFSVTEPQVLGEIDEPPRISEAFGEELQPPPASQQEVEETTRERNTQRVKKYLRHQFNEKGTSSLNFNQLMVEESHSRSNIARMFYHVLVLGTVQDIAVQQARPYGDILISKKASFDEE